MKRTILTAFIMALAITFVKFINHKDDISIDMSGLQPIEPPSIDKPKNNISPAETKTPSQKPQEKRKSAAKQSNYFVRLDDDAQVKFLKHGFGKIPVTVYYKTEGVEGCSHKNCDVGVTVALEKAYQKAFPSASEAVALQLCQTLQKMPILRQGSVDFHFRLQGTDSALTLHRDLFASCDSKEYITHLDSFLDKHQVLLKPLESLQKNLKSQKELINFDNAKVYKRRLNHIATLIEDGVIYLKGEGDKLVYKEGFETDGIYVYDIGKGEIAKYFDLDEKHTATAFGIDGNYLYMVQNGIFKIDLNTLKIVKQSNVSFGFADKLIVDGDTIYLLREDNDIWHILSFDKSSLSLKGIYKSNIALDKDTTFIKNGIFYKNDDDERLLAFDIAKDKEIHHSKKRCKAIAISDDSILCSDTSLYDINLTKKSKPIEEKARISEGFINGNIIFGLGDELFIADKKSKKIKIKQNVSSIDIYFAGYTDRYLGILDENGTGRYLLNLYDFNLSKRYAIPFVTSFGKIDASRDGYIVQAYGNELEIYNKNLQQKRRISTHQESDDDSVWFSIEGSTLCYKEADGDKGNRFVLYDLKSGKREFIPIPKANGLFGNIVKDIVISGRYIYYISLSSLKYYDRKTKEFHTLINGLNAPILKRTADGKVFLLDGGDIYLLDKTALDKLPIAGYDIAETNSTEVFIAQKNAFLLKLNEKKYRYEPNIDKPDFDIAMTEHYAVIGFGNRLDVIDKRHPQVPFVIEFENAIKPIIYVIPLSDDRVVISSTDMIAIVSLKERKVVGPSKRGK